MQRGEFLFLLDDDVFVVTEHAIRLLRDYIPQFETNNDSLLVEHRYVEVVVLYFLLLP